MNVRPYKLAGKSACATEKNDVARAPSIGDRGACYVGTGRNACATERRTSKRNAVCYDFGVVARCLLAAVMWDFVAQHRARSRNPRARLRIQPTDRSTRCGRGAQA